jgi:hypothetical protein
METKTSRSVLSQELSQSYSPPDVMQPGQDLVEQLVLDSVLPKLAQGFEVSFIDTTVLVRRQGNIGPNSSEVLIDCVLSL